LWTSSYNVVYGDDLRSNEHLSSKGA